MKINAEFNQRVVVHSADMEWIDSPMAGVSRRPLDRVGSEIARATSVVRYAKGSHFSPHVHTGGEEFIVLEGVFQDEHGDFPRGSYIRNPPKSSHTPSSKSGCIILVKLWQFRSQDPTHVRLNANFMKPTPHRKLDGVSVTPLYFDDSEEVSIQDWQSQAEVSLTANQGIEIFVLEGSFTESGDTLKKHSWLRLPVGSAFKAKAGSDGTKVWIKQHHLNRVDEEVKRIQESNNK